MWGRSRLVNIFTDEEKACVEQQFDFSEAAFWLPFSSVIKQNPKTNNAPNHDCCGTVAGLSEHILQSISGLKWSALQQRRIKRIQTQADEGWEDSGGRRRGRTGWLIAGDSSSQIKNEGKRRWWLQMIPCVARYPCFPEPAGPSSSLRHLISRQTASSKAWLRLLRLAGGATDPCSSPTGSLVKNHYWDPTDLNNCSSGLGLVTKG